MRGLVHRSKSRDVGRVSQRGLGRSLPRPPRHVKISATGHRVPGDDQVVQERDAQLGRSAG